MKQKLILHPFLFAIYPIISLFAFNIKQLTPVETVRALGVVMLSTLILFMILKVLLKDWHRAGFLVSIYLILFFSFGHVVRGIQDIGLDIRVADLTRYVASIWATLFILVTWASWRLLRPETKASSQFLNVLAMAALIVPSLNIISYTVSKFGVQSTLPADSQEKIELTIPHGADLPDIYLIIMDSYAREDVLQEVYFYDNSDFIDFLEDKDFYVASKSHSNYSQTLLSLSSSMNMMHIKELAERLGADYEDRQPLVNLLQNNKVMKSLRTQGYKTVSISSGWTPTSLKDSALYLSSDASFLNDFEGMLILNTLPGTLYRTNFLYELQRRRILYIFQSLQEIPTIKGPKFVFAHVISPHPPFVFGPNGEKIDTTQYYSLNEGIKFVVDKEFTNSRYRDQLTYMNKLLKETIDEILATSEKPPIILLQADHGPGALSSADKTCFKKKMSILNAFYFPPHDHDRKLLYDSITPVNSFRVLFDLYFGSHLGLLEDKSYYSLAETPYNFIDVSDLTEKTCGIKD